VTAGRARLPWWAWLFGLALALRLGWLFLANEPLVYAHQQRYLQSALAIVESPRPFHFILASDEWRRWIGTWTIAPLYQLFAAAVFGLFGTHLLPLQLVQCAMEAATAVGVGILGRRLAGPPGTWAGVAYAVYWPAVQMPSGTLTENLHTPLLVLAFVLLARAESAPAHAGAGLALGVSALARSVGSAFVPLAVLVILLKKGWRAGLWPSILFVAGACLAILPWTARNVFVVGDPVLIESIGVYNLWEDNAFRDGHAVVADQTRMDAWVFREAMPESERRARATAESLAGIRAFPELFVRKIGLNFAHFVRPDMLHQLLEVELAETPLRYVLGIAFDDLLLLGMLPLFVVFLAAAPRSPGWWLIALWTAYYLFMVVVVFHNEIRYRSPLVPFALAGAAGGLALLSSRDSRRRPLVRAGLAFGLGLALWAVAPALRSGTAAVRAAWLLRGLDDEVARGDLAAAKERARRASDARPRSARAWLALGHALAWNDRPGPAVAAYRRAATRRGDNWIPTLVLPQLLRDAGDEEPGARVATKRAIEFSDAVDPWLALEIAWRELPPPRADQIDVGRLDYGAARGFFDPVAGGRWSRAEARLRLVPTLPAPAYDVTLVMGSPEPSPLDGPEVEVWTNGGARTRFHLKREALPYMFRTAAPVEGALEVGLEAPTWMRHGQRAEQGVRVERMTVAPAR
jgi:hypothetical protein